MKTLSLSAAALSGALLTAGVALAAPPASDATYANARFGYAIGYPRGLLVPEREADNGDGRRFHPRHGAASMAVWGGLRMDGETPADIAHDYMDRCAPGKLAYKAV